MKLSSDTLELRAIRTICSNKSYSAYLLGKMKQEYLHTEAAHAAYHRILATVRSGGEIPSMDMLSEDPMLSETIRSKLSKFKKKSLNEKEVDKALHRLNEYHITRNVLLLAEESVESLQGESVDVNKVLDSISDRVAQMRSGTANAKMWKFGSGNNTAEVINELLDGDGPNLIPTTFDAWDSVNGGIPDTACMIIAATTGGGKSISAASMCKNLAEIGYSPSVLPLEMSKVEMAARLVSAISEISVEKVVQGKKRLTPDEIKHIKKTYKAWINKVKEAGGSYMLYEPDSTPNMTQALYSMKAYAPDVIIIDYVALLDDVDGDDDWRKLSEAVREGKRFAKTNHIPVIILAQLGFDKQLRYSKRMLDDADVAWVWAGDDEARETGIIHVSSPKARNMKPLNFDLFVEWEHTYMRDVTEKDLEGIDNDDDDDEDDDEVSNRRSSKRKKQKKNTPVLNDITNGSSSSIDIGD